MGYEKIALTRNRLLLQNFGILQTCDEKDAFLSYSNYCLIFFYFISFHFISSFLKYRQREQLHSEKDTTNPTLHAVVVVRSLFTSKRRLAHLVDTQLRKCVVLTGPSKPRAGELLELEG